MNEARQFRYEALAAQRDAAVAEVSRLNKVIDRLLADEPEEHIKVHGPGHVEVVSRAEQLAVRAALADLGRRFRQEADPSKTGIWRKACDLLDRLIEEAAP